MCIRERRLNFALHISHCATELDVFVQVDEAHRLKNRSSQLFSSLRRIHRGQSLLLTGTPLQNNLNELWALLSFILPGIFDDEQQFSDWFNRPFESDNEEQQQEQQHGDQEDDDHGGDGEGKNGHNPSRYEFASMDYLSVLFHLIDTFCFVFLHLH